MKGTEISSKAINEKVLKLRFEKSDQNSEAIENSSSQGKGWNLDGGKSLSIKNKEKPLTEISKVFFSGLDNKKPEEGWSGFEHRISENAKVFGLGEKTGQLDKSDSRYEMWNTDVGGSFPLNEDPMYISIPFYIVVDPEEENFFGIYVDYSGKSEFDIKYQAGKDKIGIAVQNSEVEFYIIAGSSIEEIIERYTGITGKPFMPPRWALGYQHSKYGYPENREEVMELADNFREKEMPCDVLYFDIQFMEDYKVFQWDKEKFGEPESLMDNLHEKGFKGVTIIEPGVKAKESFSVFEEGKKKDVFVKNKEGEYWKGSVYPGLCVFPDFYNPEARDWWAEKNKEFLKKGVDGLWNDMNEPAIFYSKKDLEKTKKRISDNLKDGENLGVEFLIEMRSMTLQVPEGWINKYNGERIPHEKVHNKYSLFEDKASFDAFKRLDENKRPFILSRSGFAGFQKFATTWTGDNASSWEDMRQSIPMLLNLGISGVPFVGPDVGGFAGDVSPELFTRWMQLGAFYPFFRNHSMLGTAPQEPWVFEEPYTSINRKALRLRYQIIPYLYTLMHETHETGKPIMRPLCMEFPKDKESYSVQDEFMLGNSLLVCPVLEKGKDKVHIYLPYEEESSIEWKNWWTGEVLESGHHIIETSLERIPLFIRENSGVPIFKETRKNTERIPDKMSLKFHVKDEARVPIYWDDGKTENFENGDYFSGKYVIKKKDGEISLDLNTEHEGYEVPWSYVEVE